MIIKPIKTRRFTPPKDDLFALIKETFTPKKGSDPEAAGSDPAQLKEGTVVVITSKIVAIGEGRCRKIDKNVDKYRLIQKEADEYLSKANTPKGYSFVLTIKNNLLMPTAGIDESNADGYYILWPEKPFEAAKKIHAFLKNEYGLEKFGVIISDSRTTPLRYGTMGTAIAFWGFWPLNDYRGKGDIFGRKLKFTQTNIADSLAVAAVATMGEGNEQTPMAIIEDVPFVKFGNYNFLKKNPLAISRKEDLYGPLLNAIQWKKGGLK